jgi:hypothetical protein
LAATLNKSVRPCTAAVCAPGYSTIPISLIAFAGMSVSLAVKSVTLPAIESAAQVQEA